MAKRAGEIPTIEELSVYLKNRREMFKVNSTPNNIPSLIACFGTIHDDHRLDFMPDYTLVTFLPNSWTYGLPRGIYFED